MTSNHGISINTDAILNIIALIRTIPKSNPILNCIRINANRPEIVARLLEEISGIALLKADITVSLGS